MNDIFNQDDNRNLQHRLAKLTADTRPQWGKMNAAQMVLHCQKPVDVATGDLVMKRGLLGLLLGKWIKNKFLKEQKLQKNSLTAPQFKIVDTPEFEAEKAKLMAQIRTFGEVGSDVIANKTHPIFGFMTDSEWGRLQYLHLDHHFTQFGL